MADKPILFQGEMIRAILEGRKTQTRRIITGRNEPARHLFFSGWSDSYILDDGNSEWRERAHGYKAGDRLWCRETWRNWNDSDFGNCGHEDHCSCPNEPSTPVCYRADGQEIDEEDREEYGIKWQPSIFMFRRFSRITLIVSDVRVQRLQDISEEDAMAEGAAFQGVELGFGHGQEHHHEDCFETAKESFRDLWNNINARPSPKNSDGEIHHYESFPWGGESRVEEYRGKPHIITPNPWVTATTFNPLFQNIDSIGGMTWKPGT